MIVLFHHDGPVILARHPVLTHLVSTVAVKTPGSAVGSYPTLTTVFHGGIPILTICLTR